MSRGSPQPGTPPRGSYQLRLLDSLSLPGSPHRPNEDRLGHTHDIAFAIDGATGLGDRHCMDGHGSDAAWLAAYAAEFFATRMSGCAGPTKTFIAEFIRSARERFFRGAASTEIPRYAWPSAGFAMIRLIGDRLEFSGLGDCKALLLGRDGEVVTLSALEDFFAAEGQAAERHLARLGGFDGGSLLGDDATLASLRAAREKQNTADSGVWTLGLVDDAAEHIDTVSLAASDYQLALLCSDGFSSLIDSYGALSAEQLMTIAARDGLAPLGNRIREIEREIDPDGVAYPRFKQSDDATALLLKIEH